MKNNLKSIFFSGLLAVCLTMASCGNTNRDEKTDFDESGNSTVSPVTNDGMGREIDTVKQINTETHQPIDETEVSP